MIAGHNLKLSEEFHSPFYNIGNGEAKIIRDEIEEEGATDECWCPTCAFSPRIKDKRCPKCSALCVETFRKLNTGA